MSHKKKVITKITANRGHLPQLHHPKSNTTVNIVRPLSSNKLINPSTKNSKDYWPRNIISSLFRNHNNHQCHRNYIKFCLPFSQDKMGYSNSSTFTEFKYNLSGSDKRTKWKHYMVNALARYIWCKKIYQSIVCCPYL